MLPKVVGLTPSIGICNKKVNLMRNKAFYKPILVITYRIGLVCQNWDKKLRKIKNYQKWLAWSPLSGYVTKSLVQSQFVVKKASLAFGSSKHIANELIARKLGWIESSCLYQNTSISYTYNLPH